MGTETVAPERRTTIAGYYRPENPLEAAAFDSFLELLPRLRESHAGEYVAVLGGGVIASGTDLDSVIKQARVVGRDELFYCGWVEPSEGSVIRFPSPLRTTETNRV